MNIFDGSIEFLDHENMGIDTGLMLLACVISEILGIIDASLMADLININIYLM